MPRRLTIPSAILLSFASITAAQSPTVKATLDRSQIYFGEAATYTVTIRNVSNPDPPTVAPPPGLTMEGTGDRAINTTVTFNRNGVRREFVRKGHEFTFEVTPQKPGAYTIPAPVFQIDGKQLQGPAITLTASAPDQQDTVVVEIDIDHPTVYVAQPFTVTIRVLIRELSADLGDRNPLAIYKDEPFGFPGFSRRQGPGPPLLEVPWLDDKLISARLEPQQSLSDLLTPLATDNGQGFHINHLKLRSTFSLLSDGATAFQPPSRRITRRVGNKDIRYWQYEISRTFSAFATQSFPFGPVRLRGFFVEGEGRDLELRQLYVIAPQKTVVCKDVPVAGRPDDYIGAAGRFTMRSTLTPTKASVGDPMTLAIRLKGVGNLDFAQPPALDQMPAVTDAFQVQQPTSETVNNERVFTFSIRPLRSDVREFPAVRASYFDVDQDEYVQLETKPVPLKISSTEHLAATDIVSSGGRVSNGDTMVADNDGVFANISDITQLRNEQVRPRFWLSLWGGMLGVYATTTFAVGQYRRRQSDPARLRRRTAPGRAQDQLKAAKRDLRSGRKETGVANLQATFTGLVADLADRDAAGITPRDASRLLLDAGVSEELAGQAREVLEACDAVRYGSADAAAGLVDQAEHVLTKLLDELKSSDLLR